jgi:hypothetical protein
MLAHSGVPWVDLFPAFWQYERRADRQPLFGTTDGHMSRRGNALLGELEADALVRLRPWSSGGVVVRSSRVPAGNELARR